MHTIIFILALLPVIVFPIPSSDFRVEFLEKANEFRQKYGSPPLVRDPVTEDLAQAWAENLAKENLLHHDPFIPGRKHYGESVAMCNRTTTTGDTLNEAEKVEYVLSTLTKWEDEASKYNFDNPGYSSSSYHFTQLVWKATKEVGVGVAGNKDNAFVVVKYFPVGNWRYDYTENVRHPQ